MKNATRYEKKVKKLLKGMKKVPVEAAKPDEAVDVLVRAVLEADAAERDTPGALAAIEDEFVDVNELRVCQVKELADVLGKDFPFARRKAEMLGRVLNGVFYRTSEMSVAYMADMPKRELRRHLLELGLGEYEAGLVVLRCFGGHAMPVDRTLAETLEMNGLVEPGSGPADVQGFLERIVAQKDAWSAHVFFRGYVARHAKALAKKRKAEAEEAARIAAKAAEAKARAEEEARARAEAKARKKAEKEASKAKAAKEAAKKKAAKKRAAKKKAAAKKAARKAVKKKAVQKKPATRKVVKKAVKKTAKKAAQKAAARKKPTRKK